MSKREMPEVKRIKAEGYEKAKLSKYTKMTGIDLPRVMCKDGQVRRLEEFTRSILQELEEKEGEVLCLCDKNQRLRERMEEAEFIIYGINRSRKYFLKDDYIELIERVDSFLSESQKGE